MLSRCKIKATDRGLGLLSGLQTQSPVLRATGFVACQRGGGAGHRPEQRLESIQVSKQTASPTPSSIQIQSKCETQLTAV